MVKIESSNFFKTGEFHAKRQLPISLSGYYIICATAKNQLPVG